MFGMVDAYAPGVAPAKGSGFTGDPMPVKLIVEPQNDGRATGSNHDLVGNFVAPAAGRYLFVLQGAGGWASGGGNWGGPGSLAARIVRLRRSQEVPYLVAYASFGLGLAISDSTVTFPDRVMTAGSGQDGRDDRPEDDPPTIGGPGIGGVATGGEININGVTGASQAASYGPFIGGKVAAGGSYSPGAPGGPGGNNGLSQAGGNARLTVVYIGP